MSRQAADRRCELRRRALRALAACGFFMLAGLPRKGAADEDSYPAQPLHLIVSFPAGTAVDTLGRIVGAKLSTALGQPVIVRNHPGAAGNIGTALAARAAPDGYTLAVVGAAVTINATLYGTRAVDRVIAFAR
jgi:tripartite-type tricarboxylate transporter receptor subunit TctC